MNNVGLSYVQIVMLIVISFVVADNASDAISAMAIGLIIAILLQIAGLRDDYNKMGLRNDHKCAEESGKLNQGNNDNKP